jgi:DNA invertase Pin-like site-specific DNA recombinase
MDDGKMRLLLAARLSRLSANGEQGLGIDTQDERATEWSAREGHEIIAVTADTKSGTVAPWDRPKLRPWVTDPEKMALYDGILAYRNDRLSRGCWDDEARIRMWAKDNGKHLVIVDGPQWPPRDDGDRWQWEAMSIQARKEWEAIRERSMRAQKKLRDDGKLVGTPPWGFEVTGRKYDKTMVPTDLGREYIPLIFGCCIAGESLASIAAWLHAEGVPSPNGREFWQVHAVARIIRNPAYMGRRCAQDRQDSNRTYTRVILTCEAIVDAATFKRAKQRADGAAETRPAERRPSLDAGRGPLLPAMRLPDVQAQQHGLLPVPRAAKAWHSVLREHGSAGDSRRDGVGADREVGRPDHRAEDHLRP